MQVVEGAFSKALPLEGLSVDYSLSQSGVLGAFSNGTRVVTNAQGIAVNSFTPTGFEEGFSGSFQILATPVNLASFVQQVEGGSITIDTFERSMANNTPSSSLDVSQFVGLAELWERRDRTLTCATIPDFSWTEETKEPADRADNNRSQANENCFSSSLFKTPNHLIDQKASHGE